MAAPGERPEKLTDRQLRDIETVLWAGGTRKLAADYVGCAVRTINAAIKEDADFAKRVRKSEGSSEFEYLANIRNAGKEQRYWRAASWALERIDPQRYAPRRPDAITIEQIRRMVGQFCDIVNAEIPIRYRSRVLARLGAIFGGLGIEPKRRAPNHDG